MLTRARGFPTPDTEEALDSRTLDDALARTVLSEIARTHRIFGGRTAAWRGVDRMLHALPSGRPLTLLDLGAGTGDLAAYVARRAARRGIVIRPIGLDHHRAAARLARQRGLAAVVADTLAVPFGDRSVDVVLASLLLHHLGRETAVALVRRLDRLARHAVIIADLRRSRVAATAFGVAARALWLHPVTRRDGIVSIGRGFSAHELALLLRQAGVQASVRRSWGARLVAAWSPSHAHA